MTYKTNWLRGVLGPMLVSCTFAASAVPTNIAVAGGFHTIFIDNGAVFGMGDNARGQIAAATATQHYTPYFTGILNAKSVSVNWNRTAILRNDGSIMINGYDWSTRLPAQRTFNVNATDVALTVRETYYVSNGTLFRLIDGQAPTAVPGGTNVKHVGAGLDHILVLFNDGTVGALGGQAFGQLGNGVISATPSTAIVSTGLTNIVQIMAGEYRSAARNAAGEIFVFGMNDRGYLTTGTTTSQSTPFKLPGVTGAKKVQISRGTTSYLAADGSLMVAGWHNWVGDGLSYFNLSFTKLPTGPVKDYVAGNDYIIISRGEVGKLEGLGGNGMGKLGDGTNREAYRLTTAFFTPVTPPPPPAPVVTAPAPAPVVTAPAPAPVVAKPADPTCNFTPFQKVSMTDIIRCQIPMYTSMNQCVADFNAKKIPGAGQVCKDLIIPADRGQQEKAPGKQ